MFSQFVHSMHCDVQSVAAGHSSFSLPSFDPDDVITLCRDAHLLFSQDPVVLDLDAPITVVGDLHGQILDLYRIIQQHGMPGTTRYLFLGDFVDRGPFSFEVVTFVFLAKVIFPNAMWVIRGNHEFGYICSDGGFRDQLLRLFRDDQVFTMFCAAFTEMPLAALIGSSILAVHGGIGPEFRSINQLRGITRPIEEFDNGVIDCVLWSDPNDETEGFEPSPRGAGYVFGKDGFAKFMDANCLNLMVRGHECVADGYQWHFDEKLLTVFSASNYCGTSGNKAAVLVIGGGRSLELKTFDPLPRLTREIIVPPERPASVERPGKEPIVAKKGLPLRHISRRPDGLRPPGLPRPRAASKADRIEPRLSMVWRPSISDI
jgi:protein phosphatase